MLETYDLLLEYRALVVAEVALQVDHCLLAVPGTRREAIKRVFSHPQALAQCEAFIVREHLEPVPAYDTAGAAKQIQQEGRHDQAAIAGRRAAELYDLEILAERVQTVQENITRFFLITRRGPRRPKPPSIKRPRYGKKTQKLRGVRRQPEQVGVTPASRPTVGIPLLPGSRWRPVRKAGGGFTAHGPPCHHLPAGAGHLHARTSAVRSAETSQPQAAFAGRAIACVMSAGVLEPGRDAVDRSQHRLQVRRAARIASRQPAQFAQQAHLEIAHRVDVGIA